MPLVSKVIAQEGSMYIFTDTTGKSNHYIFRSDISEGNKTSASVLPDMRLKNMHLVMVNPGKNKLYDFVVNNLDCHFDEKKRILKIETSTDMLIKSLAFNTNRGSYLENKTFVGNLIYNWIKIQIRYHLKTLSWNWTIILISLVAASTLIVLRGCSI